MDLIKALKTGKHETMLLKINVFKVLYCLLNIATIEDVASVDPINFFLYVSSNFF